MAASSNKAQPTVDEIIALLKKTSLPTVLCEGSDDLIVYRRLEEHLGHLGISVLPAGGRNNVLQVFDRRAEIPGSVQLVFIADRDIWINVGVPPQYVAPNIIFTEGYSIENDVWVDGNLENLLVGDETIRFHSELGDFIHWYALALNRHVNDPTQSIANHPDHVLDPAQRPALLALLPNEAYPIGTKVNLQANYQTLVRGKSLLNLLIRNTNSRRGQPKHSDKALLEMVAARPGPILSRLNSQVESVLSI